MDCLRNRLVQGRVLDGRFETISPLNHGSFGMVFTARDLDTDEIVAVKCLTKASASSNCPSAFAVDEQSEEVAIHHDIEYHPNIVNLVHSFETHNHIYLILEFCSNGDLYEAISLGKGPLQTEHVRAFMLQLVGAVEFLHAKGISHRDIKPENIFLTASGSMKLGDFGLATREALSHESAVGSDRYMAPEQYDPPETGYSPAQADVWAIGICLLNVLFSRNPFAMPALSDPLFADFAGDRQSLFDVFPNMSQDAYEVLSHCLVIDPAYRSLAAVKESLERAISFTIDDETLDEFCTDDRDVVPATANREPLRTPSVTSPQLDHAGSFPWAKALALSPPPQQYRQLSTIQDTEIYADDEDLFPAQGSGRDWFAVKPDSASTASFVDSGLGVSFKSYESTKPEPRQVNRSRPVPISGSLPINVSRGPTFSSLFGKKRDFASKSWSDLWDEDEEEGQVGSESENPVTPLGMIKNWGRESESGISTPRAGLTELKNPAMVNNSRDRSPHNVKSVDTRVSEHTGFIFEDHPAQAARYSPSSKRNLLDKWSALGDRRRGGTPQKPAAPAPQDLDTPRKRSRAASWKRQIGWGTSAPTTANEHNFEHNSNHGVYGRKEWSLSSNWRQQSPTSAQPPHHPSGKSHDDIGDLEWVGGWNDLHL